MTIKEAKTFEQQISLIRQKGFIIEDELSCIDFLKRANYYRLSAYYLPFRNRDGTFIEGIHITKVQRIYDFDSKMRALLFEVIEEIEFYLRTQFAYYFGHKYGALGYLDNSNFSEKHKDDRFLEKVDSCINENKNTLIVKHHNERYDGKFPIWVIIEFFSIGMLSYFYGDMITEDMKKLGTEIYSTSPEQIKSWLRCLTDLRNKCAHHSRLYYWSFSAIPKMPKGFESNPSRKLFTQILVLKFLFPEKSRWNKKILHEIRQLFDEYSKDISLNHLGFIDDWEDKLLLI